MKKSYAVVAMLLIFALSVPVIAHADSQSAFVTSIQKEFTKHGNSAPTESSDLHSQARIRAKTSANTGNILVNKTYKTSSTLIITLSEGNAFLDSWPIIRTSALMTTLRDNSTFAAAAKAGGWKRLGVGLAEARKGLHVVVILKK